MVEQAEQARSPERTSKRKSLAIGAILIGGNQAFFL